jgi:hypothetical protein
MQKALMQFMAWVCRGLYPRRQTGCAVVSVSIFLMMIIAPGSVFGHQADAPFSGAIIEPLEVHHAHIENEQRLSFAYVDGFSKEGGETRAAFATIVELATVWTSKFNLGSEIFIPFSNTGDANDEYNIGDLEVWPIKYALINKPETILTGVLSLTLPTGNKSQGLGDGNTAVGALFLFDQAYRNWFWGVNTEIATTISRESGTEAEFSSVISYSFIRETQEGMAPPRPNQAIVPVLSLELISELIVEGENDGEQVFSVLPGVHLWHPASDWNVGLGVQVPVSSDKDFDAAVLLQLRNHLAWGELFGKH